LALEFDIIKHMGPRQNIKQHSIKRRPLTHAKYEMVENVFFV